MADDAQEKEKPIRGSDFIERYANNVLFESSAWDLKAIFGTLDQSVSPSRLKQHTAITTTWAQAKIAMYFLYVNVLFHEVQNGPIPVPQNVRPADLASVFDEDFFSTPEAKAALERVQRLHKDLF